MTIETANKFLVSVKGETIHILRPEQYMSRKDALNLAAWLVAVADYDDEFPALLEAIKNT